MPKNLPPKTEALNALRSSLSKILTLSEEEFRLFSSALTWSSLKKKAILLREGEICEFTTFIAKGCLRYFYIVNGDEHTGQFFFENSWYTDYESFLSGEPSRQNIMCLESTELLMLSKKDLDHLYDQNPRFERLGRFMAERAYLGIRKKNEALTNLSAEERYINLIKERPKVFERIPQHYIASYLGIHPQSLSRIRKRITFG